MTSGGTGTKKHRAGLSKRKAQSPFQFATEFGNRFPGRCVYIPARLCTPCSASADAPISQNGLLFQTVRTLPDAPRPLNASSCGTCCRVLRILKFQLSPIPSAVNA
jgi:hypothetical protein